MAVDRQRIPAAGAAREILPAAGGAAHQAGSAGDRAGSPGAGRAGAGAGRTAAMFLAPFGVLFALFFLLPIGYAIYESLLKAHVSGLGLGPGSTTTQFAASPTTPRSSPTRRSGRAWAGCCCSGWSRSR